jgi:hypothetical protein
MAAICSVGLHGAGRSKSDLGGDPEVAASRSSCGSTNRFWEGGGTTPRGQEDIG